MTRPSGFSDLKHLVELADKGDWEAIDRELDQDHAAKEAWVKDQKQRNPKVIAPGFEDDDREAAMDHVLMAAVKHAPYNTVVRAVRNMEYNMMTFMEARRWAVDNNKGKALKLFDRFAASFPQPLRDLFNYPPGKDLDPRVHERVQAGSLSKMRKKRPGQKPRP